MQQRGKIIYTEASEAKEFDVSSVEKKDRYEISLRLQARPLITITNEHHRDS